MSLCKDPEVHLRGSVTVVIPAWNAESTIEECLESLKAQTAAPEEILLVDDGSSDSTAEVAVRHGVKLLATGGRRGPATARNMGAEAASGDILVFLDADVTVPNNLVEKIKMHFADESVWAVQTLYTPVCPAEDNVSRYQNYYYWYSLNRTHGGASATFATWCAAVRRNRFLETGGFNVRIPEPTVEDEELGYTIADSGGEIILDRDLLVTHLASYTLSQFTRRRLRMARAQAKSGWRQVKNRLIARYINVRESGTHHSRWVVLSILLVLMAELSILAAVIWMSLASVASALAFLILSIFCQGRFLKKAARDLGKQVLLTFTVLCLYDMAVLGWGIVQGTIQFASGKKY